MKLFCAKLLDKYFVLNHTNILFGSKGKMNRETFLTDS